MKRRRGRIITFTLYIYRGMYTKVSQYPLSSPPPTLFLSGGGQCVRTNSHWHCQEFYQ